MVANFRRLQGDCTEGIRTIPFSGHCDLGLMARNLCAAPRGNMSLPVLSSIILRRQLAVDPRVCVSPSWGLTTLCENFVHHAVLEAFAAWSIHSVLKNMDTPQVVTSQTAGGTQVAMVAPDGREVARGVIALDRPATFHDVKVTKTRALMVVREVLVPGYLISPTLTPSHQPMSLSAFGSVPFVLLCQANHLHTVTHPAPGSGNQRQRSGMSMADHPPIPDWSQCSNGAADIDENPVDVTEGRYAWWEVEDGDVVDQCASTSESDPVAHEAICSLLHAITRFDPESMTVLRSRILGDIWHLFHQFPIPLHHGLRRPFSRALSSAIFFTDPGDRHAVEEVLQKMGNMTYEAKLLCKPKWVLARVRRYVPPPEILFDRVAAVVKTFGPLKDSTTGQPLFTEKAWDVMKNILEHIRRGYYSDPPGIPLYFEVGKDRHGLTLYRCCRGTNDLEGGVHQNLIRRFTSFNVSPRRAVNMILDYAVCHNMQVGPVACFPIACALSHWQVGTENRTGCSYIGHFDVSLKNRVSTLLEITAGYFGCDSQGGYGKWVNGNNYQRTTESFGILPFDGAAQNCLSMLPYHHTFALEQKVRHRYLSERQGTRFSVLPIHTQSERALFQLYARSSHHFTSAQGPNFAALAREMNAHADGLTIFYKVTAIS